MTDNNQLEKYIKQNKNKMINRNFLGVFPSDQLPHVNTKNACLIANYSASDKTSEGHWIAMGNLNGQGDAWYFDSYHFKPDSDDDVLHDMTDFKDYLQKYSSTGRFFYNTYDYQGYNPPFNDVCGEYSALAIVTDWGKNPNAPIWVKLRSISNPIERDGYVKKYVGIRK